MTNDLSEKKRLSLVALYQQMPMQELERRIAAGQLAAPAQAIAQDVLNERLEDGDVADATMIAAGARIVQLATRLGRLVIPQAHAPRRWPTSQANPPRPPRPPPTPRRPLPRRLARRLCLLVPRQRSDDEWPCMVA